MLLSPAPRKPSPQPAPAGLAIAPPMQYAMPPFEGGAAGREYLREEPLTMTMDVPLGATPGTKLQCNAPDGQELRLTVPEGVPPGSVMTLTQDPLTRQWKCMAEPADAPPTLQPYGGEAFYGGGAGGVTFSPSSEQRYGRVTKSYSPAKIISDSTSAIAVGSYTGQELLGVGGRAMAQPMAVNLSYVPPAGSFNTPRQQELSYEQSHSYTPPRGQPGSFVERRQSYTAPTQVASYTPALQGAVLEQRPSYSPGPQVGAPLQGATPGVSTIDISTTKVMPQEFAQQVVIGQSASYTPPPIVLQHNGSSYVPPPGAPVQAIDTTAAPAVEFIVLGGNQVPILTDVHLRALHPVRLREHATLLHQTIGPERLGPTIPIYLSDVELVSWIVQVQQIHLEPLRPGRGPSMNMLPRPMPQPMPQPMSIAPPQMAPGAPQPQMLHGPPHPQMLHGPPQPVTPRGGAPPMQFGQLPPSGWPQGSPPQMGFAHGPPMGAGFGPGPPMMGPGAGMGPPPPGHPLQPMMGGMPPFSNQPPHQMPPLPGSAGLWPMPGLSVPGLTMPGPIGGMMPP